MCGCVISRDSNVYGRELEDGTMVTTIHSGPCQEIAPAYHTLTSWISEYGHERTGPQREIHLNDSQTVLPEDLLARVKCSICLETLSYGAQQLGLLGLRPDKCTLCRGKTGPSSLFYPGAMPIDRSRKARAARRRKRRMGRVEHDLSDAQWSALKQAWGGCAYCGATDQALQRDCVLPLSRGGRYTLDNIVPACRSCNAGKSNREVTAWMRRKRFDERAFLTRHLDIHVELCASAVHGASQASQPQQGIEHTGPAEPETADPSPADDWVEPGGH